MHQLETLLENTIDKNFDKLEIWTLRNVLTVPDDVRGWVRLGHYEVCKLFPLSVLEGSGLEGQTRNERGGKQKQQVLSCFLLSISFEYSLFHFSQHSVTPPPPPSKCMLLTSS